MKSGVCELCSAEAAAYCSADNAFLCWSCDAKVHGANFLVARHVRQVICSGCKGFTGDRISGVGFQPYEATCHSCSPETATGGGDLDSLSSTSSSDCVSSTRSSSRVSSSEGVSRNRKRGEGRTATSWSVDSKAEGVFVNWCTNLGLGSYGPKVVRMACDALGVCVGQFTNLPFRVALAASLWFGFRFCGVKSLSTWQAIKRVEEISGVPAKVIAAAESRLERLVNVAREQRRRQRICHEPAEESCDES